MRSETGADREVTLEQVCRDVIENAINCGIVSVSNGYRTPDPQNLPAADLAVIANAMERSLFRGWVREPLPEDLPKACPFCGDEGYANGIAWGCEVDMERACCLVCEECGASGPTVYLHDGGDSSGVRDRVMEVWNKRAKS